MSQCHFVHHKSYREPRKKSGSLRCALAKPADLPFPRSHLKNKKYSNAQGRTTQRDVTRQKCKSVFTDLELLLSFTRH